MVAMLFTAISYGRMAAVYPSAGSAYAYVGHTIHPALGYVTGWSMLFDYVMNPIICVIWCSKAAANFLPLPFAVWATFFALLFTILNLQGVKTSARTNAAIAIGLVFVIVLFLVAAFRYLSGDHARRRDALAAVLRSRHLLLGQGLDRHQPRRAHLHRLRRHLDAFGRGEEPAPQHPAGDGAGVPLHRDRRQPAGVPGQLIWPDWSSYPDVDTAFVHVAGRAGGPGCSRCSTCRC